MPLVPHPRWLLLSDIHFRLHDLERTRRTAEWIVSVARQTPGLSRVVVCGDVLTARSMQPTVVLSAAYRFLADLSSAVPHIDVILGNHDLAYRRDYSTSALEALKMPRLRPYVSLYDDVGRHTWDGRDVLILPFREDQTELTAAVAELDPEQAARTIAFAHLALNRAVTQRHVIRDDGSDLGHSVRYRGLTGPDHFKALARTFTGHFHSHQVIRQPNGPPEAAGCEDPLQGSVAYLGAPLQLTWADLCDEDRGVVLLDPATLEHELVVNPHAVGYITVQGLEVLDDNVDPSTVQGKHVMMLGNLSRFQHWTARDKLLSLGAQSVREPRSRTTLGSGSNSLAYHGLGASIPASDRDVALKSTESSDLLAETSGSTVDEPGAPSQPDDLPSGKIDLVEYVPEYVRSSAVESMHEAKMIELGQRLIMASESATSFGDDAAYKALLDPSYSIATPDDSQTPSKNVFVARPRSIVISNFLGVQGECTIDFDGDLGRGLTFVVGGNGSGKSTLIEAIVWCQFGRCIRKGLSVGDVVNDVTGKDCMVSLSFSNGYTITRFRKHKIHGNRVIVSLNGVDQPQFEHGEARASQAALDNLLGIDYEEFIKTAVLGHESAASFLSSTPAQRHELIEATLGLATLDKSADLSRRMMREIDDDTAALRSRISTIEQTVSLIENRIANRERELRRLRKEEEEAREAINLMQTRSSQSQMGDDLKDHRPQHVVEEDLKTVSTRLGELTSKIRESQHAVDQAQSALKDAEACQDVAAQPPPAPDQGIHETKSQYQAFQDELLELIPRQPDPVTMKHIHSFETTLRHLAQTISWLQLHALNATGFLSSESAVNRMALHFIRIGLMSLERLSGHLNSLHGQFTSSLSRQRQEYADAIEAIVKRIGTKSTDGESNVSKPIKEKGENRTKVVLDKRLNKQPVPSPPKKVSNIDLQEARQQLSSSLNHLSGLLKEQGVLHNLQAKHQREIVNINEGARKQAALQNKLAEKEREIAIYQNLIQEETSTLEEQRASRVSIDAEMESLMSSRELFMFWEEALSRRRTKSVTASTFRGYVLDKSLEELNTLASNILLVLYENTRHARELTKGMLRTIIAADSEDSQDPKSSQNSGLLDQSLGVTKTLSYAKRSGGERKRIDLAVFFALVQILQAHSRHRARYILIDEAFDSLDGAGQTAVVRWCLQLMARTDFQLVVTHSDYLISCARGASHDEDSDGLQSQVSVMSAAMTEEGTKFSYAMA